MLAKARQTAESADVLVLVQEVNDTRPPPSAIGEADLVVRTKRDLVRPVEGEAPAEPREVIVSAHTGHGMTELREHLDQLAFGRSSGAALALNQRHLQLIADARNALGGASAAIEVNAGAELIALDLREALDHLGSIVGQITPDDVLGRVFGAFCIGK
jgi:tRNA modification GTPase